MDLSGNSLSQLPDTLGAFTSLLILKLNDSRLSGAALAPLARGMPALRELYMSKNVVTFEPEEVAGEGGGERSPTRGTSHHAISCLSLCDACEQPGI